MRYATPGAFRSALERRLQTTAQEAGVPLIRLRKLIVFDRLMARLMIAAPDRWVVKGAVALLFRLGPRSRTTKDLDLGRQDNEEGATSDFLAAQSLDLGDYFGFTIERTGKLDAMEGLAVRYHVVAELAGRIFESITVDVGFGDPLVTDAELVRGPDLLGFADIQPVEVPALPLEQHVAEKLHAYTRSYTGSRASTRVKDLLDLAAIASLFSFRADRLTRALDVTFTSRSTHSLASALPAPPSEWRTAYRRMALEADMDPDMTHGYELAAVFLNPVLAGTVTGSTQWKPDRHAWQQQRQSA